MRTPGVVMGDHSRSTVVARWDSLFLDRRMLKPGRFSEIGLKISEKRRDCLLGGAPRQACSFSLARTPRHAELFDSIRARIDQSTRTLSAAGLPLGLRHGLVTSTPAAKSTWTRLTGPPGAAIPSARRAKRGPAFVDIIAAIIVLRRQVLPRSMATLYAPSHAGNLVAI
jgi:hypothetical protein